ncbi:hypothetical protein [Mycolicibacterium goodii]|uniref:hypothetical protein n=1 Tax=Mycolicibacterium goodii TaxID=134601 RepID=UPI0018EAA69B|nr:hypothetical protein [Mycolicibacterium goodii]
MSWRHGHVAHRASGDYEAVRVFADHLDADPETLDSIRAEVVTSLGPPADSELATEFREHVKALRDTLWDQYLAPIGEQLAKATPLGQPMASPWESHPDAEGRMTLTLNLWGRRNATCTG